MRSDRDGGGLLLSVAVPVQRYKQVLGAVMLSTGSGEIEEAVRTIRLDILKVFVIALAVTVLLSLYLAGTIARPIRRLAAAAERVRRGHGAPGRDPRFHPARRRDRRPLGLAARHDRRAVAAHGRHRAASPPTSRTRSRTR